MATGPINPTQINPMTNAKSADQANKVKGKDSADKVAKSVGHDKANYDVNISKDGRQRAEEFNKALDIARSTPDVRADRVALLKAQIQAGTYQPDPGKIADGMMREAVREHLALNDGE